MGTAMSGHDLGLLDDIVEMLEWPLEAALYREVSTILRKFLGKLEVIETVVMGETNGSSFRFMKAVSGS